MHSSLRLTAILSIALAVIAAGCGSSNSSPSLTTTAPTPAVVTETFNGTLTQGNSAVFNFTVSNSGYSLLAGYTSITPTSVAALGLGIGNWDGGSQTCGLNQSQQDAAKSGSTALSGTAGSGSFCVRAYDGGNVPAGTTVSFTIQVQHY